MGFPSDAWLNWWTQRLERFKRDLRPDGPLIANIKEAVVDDQRSSYVLELRLAMRPTQTGPHNILFIRGCRRMRALDQWTESPGRLYAQLVPCCDCLVIIGEAII